MESLELKPVESEREEPRPKPAGPCPSPKSAPSAAPAKEEQVKPQPTPTPPQPKTPKNPTVRRWGLRSRGPGGGGLRILRLRLSEVTVEPSTASLEEKLSAETLLCDVSHDLGSKLGVCLR